MTTRLSTSPRWTTSTFAVGPDTLSADPMALSALGEHLAHCQGLTGRLFHWRCAADAVHRFIAPRLVTTVALASLLLVAALALKA